MSVFSERLIALMKQNRINQKELAQKAGVTESAMSYYVKGDRTPRSDVLTRIAKALETTTDYLLGTSESVSEVPRGELQYLQRNLGKLDSDQLKKAENILKAAFDDIFDDDEDIKEWAKMRQKETLLGLTENATDLNYRTISHENIRKNYC